MAKLIKTWEELKECTSETHELEIENGHGWIHPKDAANDTWQGRYYLSTHTFYKDTCVESTALLQKCGFDVIIADWDELGW